MAQGEDGAKQGQDFFQIFNKAKEFTEEMLKENERLRFKIARLESASDSTAADDRVRELQARVRELEERLAEVESRYRRVEEENKEFADRYIEVEEQNNNLANLYVASYQLHSTLDYKDVVRIVQEIVINLIGAEAFHLWMASDKTGTLVLEASEGQQPPLTSIALGEGIIGKAAQSGENYFATRVVHQEATPYDQPIAAIPLKIKDTCIGVISLNKLLVQKTAFTTMDYELFTLLAGHAATALFSAKLYSTSARKLTTLQGFLDMLKQPGKPERPSGRPAY
jgi:putative methionine-R-sulfoxide reductase with GAF domain